MSLDLENKAKNLSQICQDKAREQGVLLAGLADLTGLEGPDFSLVGSGWPRFPRAVSLMMPLNYSILDALPVGDVAAGCTYYNHYATVNQMLDQAALQVARALEEAGYLSLPVPASQILPPQGIFGIFSHKLAAHVAGAGWMGQNALFIHHRLGPRVRLATVLTRAPLPARQELQTTGETPCRKCQICIRTCPSGALHGRSFSPDEPASMRVDVKACIQYLEERQARLDLPHYSAACGMCLQACPRAPKLRAHGCV